MSFFRKSEFGGHITVRHNTSWCEGTVRVVIPSYRALTGEGPQIICSECGECRFLDCELAPVQGTTVTAEDVEAALQAERRRNLKLVDTGDTVPADGELHVATLT